MTGYGPQVPANPQLDAADIRRLLDSLASHLSEHGSTGNHLMIVGGAALTLMWGDHTTNCADIHEYRFAASTDSAAERRTAAVDFISMRSSVAIAQAARLVADAEGLPRTWLNGSVASFTPACDLEPQTLYQSAYLTVEAPSPSVLLAMKLHAARPHDLQDAAQLAHDTGITDREQLLALVANAYGPDTVTASTADFAKRALSSACH